MRITYHAVSHPLEGLECLGDASVCCEGYDARYLLCKVDGFTNTYQAGKGMEMPLKGFMALLCCLVLPVKEESPDEVIRIFGSLEPSQFSPCKTLLAACSCPVH